MDLSLRQEEHKINESLEAFVEVNFGEALADAEPMNSKHLLSDPTLVRNNARKPPFN